MATIKPKPYRHKNGWRVSFCFFGKKYAKYVGQNEQYAYFFQSKINHIVLQLRYGFIELPQANIGDFVFSQVIKKPSAPKPELLQENISVKEFINECITDAREYEDNSKKTEIIHLNHLKKYLQHCKKNCFLKNIDVEFFIQYKKFRQKQSVMAKTINKEIYTFRKFFYQAIDKKYIEENIVEKIKKDKEDGSSNIFRTTTQIKELLAQGNYSEKETKKIQRYRYLDFEEINQFIESTKKRMGINHWIVPIIIILSDTGIRRSELLELTWLDVDFDKNILYIYSNKQSKKRNKIRREVYITQRLKSTLQRQKEVAKERWVFPGPNGGKLSVNTLRTAFLKVIKGTDYEGIGFHCFRHSYVSILAEKGVNKQVIGDLVGHTSQEMTEHYRHLFPGVIEEAVKRVFG